MRTISRNEKGKKKRKREKEREEEEEGKEKVDFTSPLSNLWFCGENCQKLLVKHIG